MEANVNYTPEQQALIDFGATGRGNGISVAVAGSGKTSTCFGLISVAPAGSKVAYCAFNKKINTEFESKLDKIKDQIGARVFTGTVHKFGFAAWRRLHPRVQIAGDSKCTVIPNSQSKIAWMMDNYLNPKTKQVGVPFELRSFVAKAYNLARQWGAGVLPEFNFARIEAWWRLVDHFDLRDEFEDADGNLPDNIDDLLKEAINYTVYIIKYGIELAPKVIDFEDMIYMPLRYGITIWQYDWVIVDEAQDINPTRRAFIKKMMKMGGRAFFVGDPRQAIYGFTGADAKSFENIKTEFACHEFPLTYSFRCPKSVVKEAQKWVSHIQSTPNAAEGSVTTIDASELSKLMDLTHEDAIICRNNAPLVDLFFVFLKKGIGCHIEGRDIGEQLVKMVTRYPKIKTLTALETKLENYKNRAIMKAQQSGKEQKAEQIADAVDAILAIMHNLAPTATTADLVTKIQSMFKNADGEKKPTLTLTSSHKSKGREWQRVFWLGANRYNPSPYARQEWQVLQEDNLMYVTATRSQGQLIYVTVPMGS